jgi:hypothetical protein
MFTSTSCPMASFILMLIIISILLDSYTMFGLGLAPKNKIILVITFFIIILYSVFTLWLANKTCYNFIWVSWLIVIYVVWHIVSSIVVIIDPKTQEDVRNEFKLIDKKFDETSKQ